MPENNTDPAKAGAPAAGEKMDAPHGALRRWVTSLRGSGGPLAALVALVVLLALLSGDFLTTNNLLNVGVQASVTAVLAFGMTFVIVSGGIDLSVGSIAGLSGIVTGWTATTAGVPMWLAVLAGAASGVLAGVVSGILITAGRMPPFIATLAMLSVARGLALVLADGRPIPLDGWLATLGSGELFGFLPYPVLVLVAAAVATGLLLRRTYAGRAMYAIGGNAEAARLSGIRVDRQQVLVYALSGLFAAVAGILLAARLASAQPEAGTGYELDAIAAVVIGGASLSGGVGTAVGTLIGALILAILRNGLNLLDVSAFWQQVVIGAVIAAAVLFDTLRRRRRGGGRTGGPLRNPAVRKAGAAVLVLLVIGAGWAIVDRQRSGGASGTRIALSLSTLNNPFFVDVREGAQTEADRLGVRLTVTDAGSDPSRQANDIQNAIAQGVDAIVVNPVDSDAIVPSVRAANAANIPVVALDRAPSGGIVVTTVASDNIEGGRLAARQLADLVGSGPVAVLEGKPGTSAARDRQAGFDEEIARHPGIRVVASQPADFDRTKALDVMSNVLQSNPDVRGVFAANDEMALGAVKALGPRAGGQVKVVGFDGTPDGLAAVQAGTVNADIAQQPTALGVDAVRLAAEASGDATLAGGTESGATHSVPVQVVTKTAN